MGYVVQQDGGAVDQTGNYSWGTAQFLLPYVIGFYSTLTGRSTTWSSIIEHCEIFVAFGGLALKNGQVSPGGAAEHTQEVWLRQLAARGVAVVNGWRLHWPPFSARSVCRAAVSASAMAR